MNQRGFQATVGVQTLPYGLYTVEAKQHTTAALSGEKERQAPCTP